MPTILTPLPKTCHACRGALKPMASLQDQSVARYLGILALIGLIGGPVAVYFLFQLAAEAHHGISIKAILVAGLIGILPSIGIMTIASKFRKIATQTCPACNAATISMVRVKDDE